MVLDMLLLVYISSLWLGNIVSTRFYTFLITVWLLAAYFLRFYEVYRFTKPITILSLLLRQSFIIFVLLFAYFGFFRIALFSIEDSLKFIISLMFVIGAIKLFSYYLLRQYRSYLGGNNRKIVIIGNNKSTQQLQSFFRKRKDMGYQVLGVFAEGLSTGIKDSFDFLVQNDIDEIYCSMEEVSEEIINKYVIYADEHYCVLKFIPKSVASISSKPLQTDYYEYLPVLSIPEISLNSPINRSIKRFFDVIFSCSVIIFILSWLTPVLYILIKLESKGPIIYSHKRNGVNYKEFICFKFRSMKLGSGDEFDQVTKEDERVTKIGRFLRRTSMDELPQFFNVLKGDMSIVGPRPHMLSYTKDYAKRIDKYNFVFRHAVKPGITGLAQVKGFRGEVKSDEDIVNRIKYDIFYIENWSILFDLKICLETVVNIIKGQESAY